MRKPRSGFTIVEMMLVIAVIAILATLVTQAAISAIRNARGHRANVMAAVIQTGIATYRAQKDEWPGQVETLAKSGESSKSSGLDAVEADKVIQSVVNESGSGNPLMDVSALFVASSGSASGSDPHGLGFGEARRQGLAVSSMAFGYQATKTGKFVRFKVYYNSTNDTVTVGL